MCVCVSDLHPHFVTYLQGLHGAFPKACTGTETSSTQLYHVQQIAAKNTADPMIPPEGSFITRSALSAGANISDELSP